MADRLINDDTFGAWLFRCNPDSWHLHRFLEDGHRVVEDWSVADNSYRARMMTAGQPALLWVTRAGLRRGLGWGIAGLGWTTGEVRSAPGARHDAYWANFEQEAPYETFVPTALSLLDPGERIAAEELKTDPLLSQLEVLLQPQGHNPSWVDRDQLDALQRLLPPWPTAPQATEELVVAPAGSGFGTPEHCRDVEQAAMAAVAEHYRARGWNVEDVSAENLGWDLTCTASAGSRHLIEVKGVSGPAPTVLLTRNEYRAAVEEPDWRAAVVTDALVPKLRQVAVYGAADVTAAAEPFAYRVRLGSGQTFTK